MIVRVCVNWFASHRVGIKDVLPLSSESKIRISPSPCFFLAIFSMDNEFLHQKSFTIFSNLSNQPKNWISWLNHSWSCFLSASFIFLRVSLNDLTFCSWSSVWNFLIFSKVWNQQCWGIWSHFSSVLPKFTNFVIRQMRRQNYYPTLKIKISLFHTLLIDVLKSFIWRIYWK